MVDQVFPATSPPSPTPPAVKPGWKTSEFAGHAAAMLLTLVFASGLLTNSTAIQIAGIAAAWLGSLGYTVNRTLLKQGAGALLLFSLLAASSQSACSGTTRQREADAAGAFMSCEADSFPAGTLADATTLAIKAVMRWIGGNGAVDANGLKADARPLKTNLVRCAWDAAVAALAAKPTIANPSAPASAAMAVDRDALRASWADVRSELGWLPHASGSP